MMIDAQRARSIVSAELIRLSLKGSPEETHVFEDEKSFRVPIAWDYEDPVPPGLPMFIVDKEDGELHMPAFHPLLPIEKRVKAMTRLDL